MGEKSQSIQEDLPNPSDEQPIKRDSWMKLGQKKKLIKTSSSQSLESNPSKEKVKTKSTGLGKKLKKLEKETMTDGEMVDVSTMTDSDWRTRLVYGPRLPTIQWPDLSKIERPALPGVSLPTLPTLCDRKCVIL